MTEQHTEILRRIVESGLPNNSKEYSELCRDIFNHKSKLPNDFEINPLLMVTTEHGWDVSEILVSFLHKYLGYSCQKEDTSTPRATLNLQDRLGHGSAPLSELYSFKRISHCKGLLTLGEAIYTGTVISRTILGGYNLEFLFGFVGDYEGKKADLPDQKYEICKDLIEKGVAFYRKVDGLGLNLITRLIKDPKFIPHLTANQEEYESTLVELRSHVFDYRRSAGRDLDRLDAELGIAKMRRSISLDYLQKESGIITGGLTTVENIINDLTRDY
ncbi:MAG: hypothetical protein KJ771_01845 [Nanoarchaeota archaeon]|nr:hypothetical protein [Nanoarchaeota archaeon]